ncbi:MAG: phosphatase PAP2 family protein [Oscillatoriophycideae cyanobacterium NC_groundwater_1537_Pr4_S-0.65um_50_18]|nr:phosphatase PAP2 family protein [Oscillatoriophycideae cyanobacterium NC_groundwater_1537_Pr4_S-0.65um_50_18]
MAEVNTRLYWLVQSLIAFMPYLLAGLLAGALVLSAGVFLARFLLRSWLLPFEESFLLTLKKLATPTLDRVMSAVTYLAQGEVTIPLVILFGGILVYHKEVSAALVLTIGLSGSWLLNGIFKSFFRRKRPDLWVSPDRPMDYSYPSGHAMSAISFYGLLAADFTKFLSVPFVITATLASTLALGVGFSRLYLGVHWPTDVLSGWIAGGIWLWVCLYGLAQIGGI